MAGEDIGPDLFGIGQGYRNEFAHFPVSLGDLASAGGGLQRTVLQKRGHVDAQEIPDQKNRNQTNATDAADGGSAASPAPVLDVAAAASPTPLHRETPHL